MDKAKRDNKPFFIWHNTTRMHVWTFLSGKYKSMQNSQTNYGLEEAGMAQMDDSIGALLKHIDDIGETNNTIVIFTTDNGAEVFTWPDGGMTPFKYPRAPLATVASAYRPSSAGRARSSQAQSRTGSSLASIGYPPWLLLPEIRTSPINCSRVCNSATGPTRTISMVTIRWIFSPERAHPSATSYSTSARDLGGGSSRRLQVRVLRAALWLAGRKEHDGHAWDGQHSPGSVRAHAQPSRRVH